MQPIILETFVSPSPNIVTYRSMQRNGSHTYVLRM